MERHRYRPRRPAPARLRLEALEERSLLAVAAFGVNFYADVEGTPGEPIDGATVEVGESFFADITAQEFDPRLSGLRGVALDIAWDPAVLEEIDNPFSPGSVITPLLPAFQSGTLNAAAGTIDNLAGAASLASGQGRAIGDAGPERFALLHFRALTASAGSAITLAEGKSSIVSVPTATFTAEQFDFAHPAITVVEPVETAAETSVQFYQGSPAAPALPVSDAAIDPSQGFYVEIAMAVSRALPPTSPLASAAVATGTGDESEAAAAKGVIQTAAERVISSLPLDPGAGEFVISTLEIQTSAGVVDLPLVVSPIKELPLIPASTLRLGLAYLPCAAADAVFGAAGDELTPAAATLDDSFVQALASGLAFADTKDARDPFATDSR